MTGGNTPQVRGLAAFVGLLVAQPLFRVPHPEVEAHQRVLRVGATDLSRSGLRNICVKNEFGRRLANRADQVLAVASPVGYSISPIAPMQGVSQSLVASGDEVGLFLQFCVNPEKDNCLLTNQPDDKGTYDENRYP